MSTYKTLHEFGMDEIIIENLLLLDMQTYKNRRRGYWICKWNKEKT